jgi:hypothetical protein
MEVQNGGGGGCSAWVRNGLNHCLVVPRIYKVQDYKKITRALEFGKAKNYGGSD